MVYPAVDTVLPVDGAYCNGESPLPAQPWAENLFSTIKIVNNVLVKEVVTRDYDFHGDYIDTMSSQPLMQMDQILPKETMH